MTDEIRFTSQLTFEVVAYSGDLVVVRLHVPLFVWMAHPVEIGLDLLAEPVFYIDDAPSVSYVSQVHLLRGATEAACEEAWEIYIDLVNSAIPDQVARQVLPVNIMAWGTVTFTETQIKDFIAKQRGGSSKELALIAHGYERALTDG